MDYSDRRHRIENCGWPLPMSTNVEYGWDNPAALAPSICPATESSVKPSSFQKVFRKGHGDKAPSMTSAPLTSGHQRPEMASSTASLAALSITATPHPYCPPWITLPAELITAIFMYLDYADLQAAESVCKTWRSVIDPEGYDKKPLLERLVWSSRPWRSLLPLTKTLRLHPCIETCLLALQDPTRAPYRSVLPPPAPQVYRNLPDIRRRFGKDYAIYPPVNFVSWRGSGIASFNSSCTPVHFHHNGITVEQAMDDLFEFLKKIHHLRPTIPIFDLVKHRYRPKDKAINDQEMAKGVEEGVFYFTRVVGFTNLIGPSGFRTVTGIFMENRGLPSPEYIYLR